MVAALRLQDEADSSLPASAAVAGPSRRLSVVTSHTCAASVPAPGKVELLIHRHLNQDDGRGLAEGVADNSRQELTLTFSLQSIDRLQPGLPVSAVHFDDELSFNRHLLSIQHPSLTFILQRTNNVQPPPGFHEFTSLAAQPTPLFARLDDWTASQLSLVEPMTRPLPSTLHLHSLMARDAVTDEVAMRLQHVGVDLTQESDSPSAAAASAQSTVSLDLNTHFPHSVRLSEMRRVGITLNHRRPWTGSTTHQHSGDVDADSLHPGWTFKADESPDVMDTLLLRQFLAGRQQNAGAKGDNQNSQEQGVFISEAALRGEAEKKKRLEEEQQRQQLAGEPSNNRRRALLQTAAKADEATGERDTYTASANVSVSESVMSAVTTAERTGRRLLSSAEWSSLSLPLVTISSNQLQAFILHIESDDDEATRSDDKQQRVAVEKTSVEQQQEQEAGEKEEEAEVAQDNGLRPQPSPSPLSNDVLHGGGVSPVSGEADSVIPSRVEYLLILVVCVLAVAFFALALGLIPAKAIVRACQHCLGDGSATQPQPHSNGRNGSPASTHSSVLYAVEHWVGRAIHRMRTYVLHARYGRQRMATAV